MYKVFSILVLTLAILACSLSGAVNSAPPQSSAAAPSPVAAAAASYHYTRLTDPARTQVTDAQGHWLATFTDHAYTVTLLGPQRTFTEASAKNPVISTVWVRVCPPPSTAR